MWQTKTHVISLLPGYITDNTNLNPALFTKFVGKGVSGNEHSLISPLTSICVGHQKGNFTTIFPFDPIIMPSFGKFASIIEIKLLIQKLFQKAWMLWLSIITAQSAEHCHMRFFIKFQCGSQFQTRTLFYALKLRNHVKFNKIGGGALQKNIVYKKFARVKADYCLIMGL